MSEDTLDHEEEDIDENGEYLKMSAWVKRDGDYLVLYKDGVEVRRTKVRR